MPASIDIAGAKNRTQSQYLQDATGNHSLSPRVDMVYHFSIVYLPTGTIADPTLHTRYTTNKNKETITSKKNRNDRGDLSC